MTTTHNLTQISRTSDGFILNGESVEININLIAGECGEDTDGILNLNGNKYHIFRHQSNSGKGYSIYADDRRVDSLGIVVLNWTSDTDVVASITMN